MVVSGGKMFYSNFIAKKIKLRFETHLHKHLSRSHVVMVSFEGDTDLTALSLQPCLLEDEVKKASPADVYTCPNHLNLRFFTVVMISSKGPMTCLILFLTTLLVMWSLYEMSSSFLKHHISQWPAISLGCLPSMSRFAGV